MFRNDTLKVCFHTHGVAPFEIFCSIILAGSVSSALLPLCALLLVKQTVLESVKYSGIAWLFVAAAVFVDVDYCCSFHITDHVLPVIRPLNTRWLSNLGFAPGRISVVDDGSVCRGAGVSVRVGRVSK